MTELTPEMFKCSQTDNQQMYVNLIIISIQFAKQTAQKKCVTLF